MKQGSFLDAVKTVLSGFIGVRRGATHEEQKISPVHVIIVAVICVVAFVLTLVTVVRIVTH